MVVLPDGMIGSIFGYSICHNDNGVLNISGLDRYLLEILQTFGETCIYPALYCDEISTYQDYHNQVFSTKQTRTGCEFLYGCRENFY